MKKLNNLGKIGFDFLGMRGIITHNGLEYLPRVEKDVTLFTKTDS